MGRDRNDLIDGFRAVAIGLVMAFHYGVLGLGLPRESPIGRVGPLGVELFFVISGLVITMTALRASGAADFAVRRLARIYPALLVAATFTFLALTLHHPAGMNVSGVDYAMSLTLLAERLGFRFVDGVYWTLLIEAQFYALVALGLGLLRRRFWILVLALLVFGAVMRGVSKPLAAAVFSTWSPFFLIGMAAWYAKAERNWVAAGALALGACVAFAFSPQAIAFLPILPFVAAFLTFYLAGVKWAPVPVAWLGRISYSLYLVHQNLGLTLIHDLLNADVPPALAVTLTVGAAVLLAAALHRFVEEPGQRLIMRVWRAVQPSRTAGAVTAPA